MKSPEISTLDQPWPYEQLEQVESCPYCGSSERTIAYDDVKDWTFYFAQGKWSYWDCKVCQTLYLNPRPIEPSIYKAYTNYYTHYSKDSFVQGIKVRLRNECLAHSLNANFRPRLHLPKSLGFILKPINKKISLAFDEESLIALPKKRLLDVGCGNGSKLKFAKEIGWDVTGLEIDPSALAVMERSLNVIEGGWVELAKFENSFDCIICSHVLEHVYNPLLLLRLLFNALKSKGVLMLSLPNAKSRMRTVFGANWRGLEAPRHIAIPTLTKIIEQLEELGYVEICQSHVNDATSLESYRIKARKQYLSTFERNLLNIKIKFLSRQVDSNQSDFIQLRACKK